jgi:hypothetical protein
VSDERFLGSLLSANDQLVLALMTFEQLDRSIDADSDSEDELAEVAHQQRSELQSGGGVAGCLFLYTSSSMLSFPC